MILEPMQPLAVDPRVLRTLVGPDIKIVPGRAVMARVIVADGSGRGALSIAGFKLEAELPRDVRTGADLRLVVRDVSPERVLLTVSGHETTPVPPPQDTALPPPPPIPLPGGGTLQVAERDAHGASGGDSGAHSLALRYTAPTLGSVDLRFELDPSSLRLGVSVAPGALGLARADVDSLRQTLAEELARAVSVVVSPRREPLDIYA
jgi:hypothetical protein